jgi:hypothetical protein
MAMRTNNRLKAIIAINSKTGLAWKVHGVNDVDTHFDHALHNHIVLLQLRLSQLYVPDTLQAPARSDGLDLVGADVR